MPRALLLFNPKAGRFAAHRIVERAARILSEASWVVHTQASRDASDMASLARAAARSGLDTVIVAGGDGSLGPAVEGLLGSSTALGVLPIGTRNVWARQLGLPLLRQHDPAGLAAYVDLLRTAAVRSADVGLANGRPYLLWAGVGLDAMVVDQAERRRSRLKKKFAIPEYFVRALRTAHSFPGVLYIVDGKRADGRPLEKNGQAQIVIAANIPLYAGGLVEISPDARLDDDEMDLWFFQGKGTRQALGHAWRMMRGVHPGNPDTFRLQFKSATLRLAGPAHFYTDGEPHGQVSEIKLEVCTQALRVLVPDRAGLKIFSK